MRTNRTHALLQILALCLATAGANGQEQQLDKTHKLSPSEVKTLIKGASTPEDHLKLAEYFRQEAAEEAAAAKLHDEMAEAYEPSPLPSKFKAPTAGEMKSHCREFARNAEKASAIAAKMAADHEKLAELMRNSPAAAVHRSR